MTVTVFAAAEPVSSATPTRVATAKRPNRFIARSETLPPRAVPVDQAVLIRSSATAYVMSGACLLAGFSFPRAFPQQGLPTDLQAVSSPSDRLRNRRSQVRILSGALGSPANRRLLARPGCACRSGGPCLALASSEMEGFRTGHFELRRSPIVPAKSLRRAYIEGSTGSTYGRRLRREQRSGRHEGENRVRASTPGAKAQRRAPVSLLPASGPSPGLLPLWQYLHRVPLSFDALRALRTRRQRE